MATKRRTRAPGAAIYTRISRDPEGDKIGVSRQEKDCRELADRLGLPVVAVYTDNDIGASNRTGNKPRPQYQAMLEAVRDGLIGTIVAYSNSRLTRRPLEWIELIGLAESGALEIKTVVSGSHDLTTADGRAVALTVAAWDAAEADRISERQTASFHHKALQGKPKLQRQRAFGWEKDGLTIEPTEAERIRRAVEEILGGASITSIARRWEEEGVLTAAGGSKWEHSVLKKVLLGWRTAGVRTYHREPLYDETGQPIMGTWEPIITLRERRQALRALEAHSRVKVRQGTWPLAGLLRCGICKKPLYGATPSGTRNRATYGCKAGHLGISAGLLEAYVIRRFYAYAYWREEYGTYIQPGSSEPDPEDLQRVDEISEQIAELMEGYRTKTLPAAIAFAEVDKLYAERDELQERIEAASAEPPPTTVPFSRGMPLEDQIREVQDALARPPAEPNSSDRLEQPIPLHQGTIDSFNQLLKLLIDYIEIAKAGPDQRTMEDRASIHWRD
ncbi:recombinase family protein [Microbacterium sp. 179-I 3D3 NHS]|uniref:recombinase family protein n=1 Tax=Microbacterium sp. 179-I 3D3 NHS TaxID=3142382 RepID=UPI0039A0C9D9